MLLFLLLLLLLLLQLPNSILSSQQTFSRETVSWPTGIGQIYYLSAAAAATRRQEAEEVVTTSKVQDEDSSSFHLTGEIIFCSRHN